MKLKRILALVVSIAMVLAIVPSFGITASAADDYTLENLVSFATGNGYVFDGSYGAGKITSSNGGDKDYPLGTITAPEQWTGWSSSWDDVVKNYGDDNPDLGAGTNVNIAFDGDTNAIQFYGPKVSSLDNVATVTTSAAVQEGTSNRDFIILEWNVSTGANEFDFGFYDSDGKLFDAFRYLPSNSIGPYYADNKGGEYTYNSGQLFTGLSYTPSDGNTWLGYGTSTARIAYVNNENDGYTATYYRLDGSTYTAVTTKTFTTGNVKNLGAIKAFHSNLDNVWYSNVQLRDLKIYAGNYPSNSNETTVKAALDALEVTSMTKGANITLAAKATDEFETTVDVTWESSDPGVIAANGNVTPDANNVVTVTLTPSAQFSGATVTGAAKTVTVFPASLAGTTRDVSGSAYTVSSENLLATSDGWTDGTGTPIAESTGFDIVHVGDVAYISAKDSSGKDGVNSLKGTTAIKNGTMYLIAVTAKDFTPSWIGLDYGDGEKVQQTNNSIFENRAVNDWERVTAVFTASADTLYIASRWNNSRYESFELYELIPPETVVDVTATYKNASGQTVYTDTKSYDTELGEDGATFSEKYVYFEGEVYRLPETKLAASGDVSVDIYRYRSHENGDEEPFLVGETFYKYTGDSVVVNGDFATGAMDAWTPSSGTAITKASMGYDDVRGNYMTTDAQNAGASASNSVTTSWSVTPGTKYYFSIWVKGTAPTETNRKYNKIVDGDKNYSLDNHANDAIIAFGVGINANEWTHFETVYTPTSDTVTLFNRWASGTMSFAGLEIVPVEEAEVETKITGVMAIPDVTVIEGNEPILPSIVTLLTDVEGYTITANVTWNKGGLTKGDNTIEGMIEGYSDQKANVKVTVLEKTFDMPDQKSINDGGNDATRGNKAYLPVELKETFSMEFDLYVNAIRDSSIQIGKDGAIFGAGQIGLGTNNGNFTPTSGNGSGGGNTGGVLTTVEAGKTYRIFLTVDVANNSYTLTLTKEDGTRYDAGTRYFRTNVDYINCINMLTNGGGADGDLVISNVKFNAPGVELNDYDIAYVGVPSDVVEAAGVDTSVKTTNTTDLGYNGEKVFPNLTIPYFKGYVFKSKTVSGTTITLEYEATEDVEFFKNNTDNDAPLISLNMLGAHDAFTKNVGSKYDAAAISRGEDGASLANTFVNRTKTQDMTVLEMLNYGVRYFDVRLSRSDSETLTKNKTNATNGVFYTTHNALSDEFGPVAVTIAQWAKEHPGEVIILDFQEIWDATPAGKTESGDLHGSTAQTWSDLSTLLRNSGIYEFVTIGNSDVSGHTYGSLTNNGEKANIVLVGRAVSNGANNFIVRGPSNADGSSGYVYSNYKSSSIFDDTTIGSSYNAKYINWQINNCAKEGTHYIASLIRVMQAQSESSNLLNQSSSDNSSLYNGLQSNPTWLTSLPIIMVNGVGKNTGNIVTLLQSCNVARGVNVSYTGGTGLPTTKKMMVGTLYTGNHELVSDGNGNTYYVTTTTPNTMGSSVIPVPYNDTVNLTVAKLDSNVYTIGKNEQANRYVDNGEGQTKNNGGYSVVYFDGDAPDANFSAYTWGNGNSDNRRMGVAILDTAKDQGKYTLNANILRDTVYNNGENTVSFYALSYDEFKALDLSDFDAVTAKLTEENKVAIAKHSANDDNNINKPTSIELDAAKIRSILGGTSEVSAVAAEDGTKVVIIGDSNNGLYRLGGLEIEEGFYKVTLDTVEQDPAIVVTLESKVEGAVALKDDANKLTKLTDGKYTFTPDRDIDFTSLTLGVELVDGAQVRIGTDSTGEIKKDSGLRFIGQKTAEDNTVLAEAKTENPVGVEIIPRDLKDSGTDPVDIPISIWYSNDMFTAVLTNLYTSNYNRVFTATPYVKIDGEKYYGTPVERSIYEVAAGILVNGVDEEASVDGETYKLTKTVKAVLNAYVNAVGVRFTWTNSNTVKNDGYDYNTGKDAEKPIFFNVDLIGGDADSGYQIKVTPKDNVVFDKEQVEKTLRINNTNKAISDSLKSIEFAEDGSFTFTFKVPTA